MPRTPAVVGGKHVLGEIAMRRRLDEIHPACAQVMDAEAPVVLDPQRLEPCPSARGIRATSRAGSARMPSMAAASEHGIMGVLLGREESRP